MVERPRSNLWEILRGALVTLAAVLITGCSSESAGSLHTALVPIEVVKGGHDQCELLNGNLLDLGKITQGTRVEQAISFRNRSAKPIRVTSYEATCECLRMLGLPIELQPDEIAEAMISIDNGPTFVGELEVVVVVKHDLGNDVEFRVRCDVTAKTAKSID